MKRAELESLIETIVRKKLNEIDIPAANAHPWVIKAIQELKDDLEFYLSPKPNTKIDFKLLKSKLMEVYKMINKYHK